jgi:hypothetical protein
LEERFEQRLELFGVYRFAEIVVGARLKSLEALIEGVVAGEHEDWHMRERRPTAELAADLVAINAGHEDIEEDEVGRGLLDLSERLGPTARRHHVIARREQDPAHIGEAEGVVIDV